MKALIKTSLIVLMSLVWLNTSAQCYQSNMTKGKNAYSNRQYSSAKTFFNNAKKCSDCKSVADANQWITKTNNEINYSSNLKKGKKYYNSRDYDNALTYFEKTKRYKRTKEVNNWINKSNNEINYSFNLKKGKKYYNSRDYDKALTHFENAKRYKWTNDVSNRINETNTHINNKIANNNNNNNPQNNTPAGMILVKGGKFQMGSNDGYSDEKPTHSVTVSSFYISKYEVTNEEFCKFLNAYGSDKVKSGTYAGKTMIYDNKSGSYPWGLYKSGSTWYPINGYAKYPVIYVTWYGANEYCKWAGGRLPTEAEWEYAAGGGSSHQKWAGTNSESSLGSYAWYSSNSGSKTHPVGTKLPNSLGIYDMSGNVWEWCSDWFKGYPGSSGVSDYTGSSRVLRGGSWGNYANYCRVALRSSYDPTFSGILLGFRLVRAF